MPFKILHSHTLVLMHELEGRHTFHSANLLSTEGPCNERINNFKLLFLHWAGIAALLETLEQENREQPYTSETSLIILVREKYGLLIMLL